MRYTTRTEYGLISLMHMAKKSSEGRMTIKELAELENYSISYVEKIFQSLRAAHIVTAYQGNQGGYALSRSPSEITLKEIIEALEGNTFDVFCECQDIICNHARTCAVKNVWKKTKELLDHHYDVITLGQLVDESSSVETPALSRTGHPSTAPRGEA